MRAAPAILQTSGLGKDYGARAAVRALDLEVAEGELFGLLGPNGAGKTTAISMICGVTTPSRGSARVAGHDVSRDRYAARAAVGLVPQDLALYEELTARENLAFFGAAYGLAGAALRERVDWALGIAGLADRGRERVDTYSGGMKRRLNIAAGILHRPRLLILDEPTVGVDPQSRNHIFDSIRALQKGGMTLVYTSHYMEEVQALCTRIAIMDHGDIVARGTMEELIATHAGGALELELEGDIAAALAALAAHGEPTVVGGRLRVVPRGRIGDAIRAVEDTGALVKRVRTLDADLETVFLTLTGHRLRDE